MQAAIEGDAAGATMNVFPAFVLVEPGATTDVSVHFELPSAAVMDLPVRPTPRTATCSRSAER
ncbi:MAG: hypothetical protein R2705_08330 [Ilumatobacteraceae bacterium]